MHEMSIAEGILKIAVDVMKKNHCRKIRAIGLRLGEMSGVELEALRNIFKGNEARRSTRHSLDRRSVG